MLYEIKLDGFQGPLELLYQLIKKNKIEISEISLSEVTEQYLEYLNKLQSFDMEMASEFMIIAAELIQIKTRALLPEEQNEIEEEEESSLVRRLKEYHYFKKLSELLNDLEKEGAKMFVRTATCREKNILSNNFKLNLQIELGELMQAYKNAVVAASLEIEEKQPPPELKGAEIEAEKIKIEDKIKYIKEKLLAVPSGLSFSELLEEKNNRLEVIVTFLSILELAKSKKIKLKQNEVFESIRIV